MINFNGELVENNTLFLNEENRGLRYGDSLFESIRVVNGKIYFWEDHYLRLMASMRILRMEIPMNFTMEYLEEQILETINADNLQNNAVRIRLTVFRNNGGLYLPTTNNVSFIIETKVLENAFYIHSDEAYEVELFKDHYVNSGLLSTLKSNNKIINVLGSIYAKENGYSNCLLLNNQKQVVEALNGNLFLVKGHTIKTPPLKDGCLNGITRKKLIASLEKLENYSLEEASISPFELQKADELFVTNVITGIQSITKYRKKEFTNTVAKDLLGKLNAVARLS
ncbi:MULTISPECIES: aminotransferase class IV [unclassified Cellulophaga]|uniref:aminotransferase class IV n=1 Tax=unclassified Cellulophaga TaxID=2634405 RepID=UPI0026E2515F|nr:MULTISPECIES: aminotransferase class IV [unclassified Cellulophaga]MDO6490895.1 aminotransferase class IV [Cellulophaga sp. 2_MG-2023]MDO6493911.1 aminotransferase class IV [Cellulophaga sp. 3_MG-2023]